MGRIATAASAWRPSPPRKLHPITLPSPVHTPLCTRVFSSSSCAFSCTETSSLFSYLQRPLRTLTYISILLLISFTTSHNLKKTNTAPLLFLFLHTLCTAVFPSTLLRFSISHFFMLSFACPVRR